MLTTLALSLLEKLGISKTVAKVLGALFLAAALTASHTYVYFAGKRAKEAEYVAANIEQIQNDALTNAERIESQITRMNRAAKRLEEANKKVQGAIDANTEANLNPSCSTSDDELREFNEAISQANRGVPRDGGD
jgi:TolA-binding protein